MFFKLDEICILVSSCTLELVVNYGVFLCAQQHDRQVNIKGAETGSVR